MPIYEFKCEKCNLKFEKSLKMVENASTACINCNEITSIRLPSKGVLSKVGESTKIPKDLDLAVGRDAEKKWMSYEERNKEKEKIRKSSDTHVISRDSEGNYSPLVIQKDGEEIKSKDALKVRRDLYDTMDTIKKDKESEYFSNNE